MGEKNRRLLQGNDIVYPITKQENVIGLQKTITDKMTIVSTTQPIADIVEKQIWIQPQGEAEDINVDVQNIVENNFESLQEEENFGSHEDIVENNYEGEN